MESGPRNRLMWFTLLSWTNFYYKILTITLFWHTTVYISWEFLYGVVSEKYTYFGRNSVRFVFMSISKEVLKILSFYYIKIQFSLERLYETWFTTLLQPHQVFDTNWHSELCLDIVKIALFEKWSEKWANPNGSAKRTDGQTDSDAQGI